MHAVSIRSLDAAQAQTRLDELGAIILDVVAHGASVNFMADVTQAQAEDFWRKLLPGLSDGKARLFVAEADGRIVGTVILFFAQQPNQPHRGEIGKMLVHSSMRRQGIGERLLRTAEEAARAAGRTLLVLDTEENSAGDRLYRRCGWIPFGTVPNYALMPDGSPCAATFFYKRNM